MKKKVVKYWLETGESYKNIAEKFGVSNFMIRLAIDEFLENERNKKSV